MATGGVVSTVHVYEAGLGSMFVAVSVARTWNVWLPSTSAEYVLGVEHDVNEPPSREHAKVEPASFDDKSNVAPVAVVTRAG